MIGNNRENLAQRSFRSIQVPILLQQSMAVDDLRQERIGELRLGISQDRFCGIEFLSDHTGTTPKHCAFHLSVPRHFEFLKRLLQSAPIRGIQVVFGESNKGRHVIWPQLQDFFPLSDCFVEPSLASVDQTERVPGFVASEIGIHAREILARLSFEKPTIVVRSSRRRCADSSGPAGAPGGTCTERGSRWPTTTAGSVPGAGGGVKPYQGPAFRVWRAAPSGSSCAREFRLTPSMSTPMTAMRTANMTRRSRTNIDSSQSRMTCECGARCTGTSA